MNWIAVRQNGNGEGKTDKYMVNNTQKGNKPEEEKEYENKMRNDLEHMRNTPFLAKNSEKTMRNTVLCFISHGII